MSKTTTTDGDYPTVTAVGDDGGSETFGLDLERFYIQALNQRFWILGIIALGLLAGLLATLLSTELFRSTARIEISRVTANVTEAEPIELESRGAYIQYFNTQYELLESKFLAQRVIDAGNLARDEEFLSAFELDNGGEVPESRIERILLANVQIEPVPNSSLVDIRFSSPAKQVSADLANLWAQEFLDANYQKRFGANVEAREFLEEQIEELRERLALSEKELIDYANANEIVILDTGGEGEDGTEKSTSTLVGSELAALNTALAEATTRRIAAESALRAGTRNEAGAAASAGLRSKLAEAQSQLAELRSKFGPGYPEIKAKEAEIASLKQALSGESTKAGAGGHRRSASERICSR